MGDMWKVLDCRVDELAANLNAQTESRALVSQDYYTLKGVRRVTVLMMRPAPIAASLPPGFDPRGNRRN